MEKLSMQKAQTLLEASTTKPHLLQHALAVSAAMGALARRFDGDEDYWRAIGLLHDYDFESHPDEHLQHTEAPLRQAGVDDESIRAILSHGYGICNDVEPQTMMEKSLYTVDELTGLVSASAKMRPNGIADMKAKSVRKKFKDKNFAAKIDRDTIQQGAAMLDIELSELITLCIDGMKPHADALGLQGTTP